VRSTPTACTELRLAPTPAWHSRHQVDRALSLGKPLDVQMTISPEALASLTDEELAIALKVAEKLAAGGA